MSSEVMNLAKGQWFEILTHFDLPAEALKNTHGPCPICSGKDRFRWDNKSGRGTYFCNQCGAGDGMNLLRKVKGWDFATSANSIRQFLRREPTFRKTSVKKKIDTNFLVSKLYRTSQKIQQGDPVDRYLRARRIYKYNYPKDLRTCLECYFERGVNYPAMLAVVRDSNGNPSTFHRTFLHPDGKPPFGTTKKFLPGPHPDGAHVCLGAVQAELGIAEGIETAMVCIKRFGLPVWAALTANLLGNWQPPPGLEVLHIFADNDRSGAGLKAANKLAGRMQELGIKTNILIPDQIDTDWADVVFRESGGSDGY